MSSPTGASESSGTLTGQDNNVSSVQQGLDASLIQDAEQIVPPEGVPASTEEDSRDQALESHEVIELQIFSEKKAWIQEKIKVFVHNSHKIPRLHNNRCVVPRKPTTSRGVRRPR
jgi:hypothetical protein